MKRNAKQEFLAALERELKSGGFPSGKATQNFLRSLTAGKAPKGINPATAPFFYAVAQGIRKSAKKRKFKSEAELDQELEQMRGLGHKLRESLTHGLREIESTFPRKKPGPSPRLTDNEKAAIRNLIQSYRANRMTVQFAIEQAAKQYKTTRRAIRRVWESAGS